MNRDQLEARTLTFSNDLLRVLQGLPSNLINNKIIGQLIRSGTSIGANYREANSAESPRDFQHKMNISFKEAKETRYWLDLLLPTNINHGKELSLLRNEADQLMRIFGKAVSTCKINAQIKKSNQKSKI